MTKLYQSSFSGCDMTAVLGNKIVGTLQAISYTATREKGPIYVMGSADPIAFARGKRAVAGTLIFSTIYENSLLNHFDKGAGINVNNTKQFYAKRKDIKFDYATKNGSLNEDVSAMFGFANGRVDTNLTSLTNPAGLFNNSTNGEQGPGAETILADAWFADQLMPFDVNISAANETGGAMKKTFSGIEILNEGGGVSIDDLVVEEQYTYICRSMTPWTKVSFKDDSRNLMTNQNVLNTIVPT